MNGEQPPYHMGAQVRPSRTQSALLRPAACHHLCACVWISLVQRGNDVVLCVCFAVQLCLNVLFLSLSGRTLNHASQKDSIVPERAGWGAHHMHARVRRLSVSLFKWLHCDLYSVMLFCKDSHAPFIIIKAYSYQEWSVKWLINYFMRNIHTCEQRGIFVNVNNLTIKSDYYQISPALNKCKIAIYWYNDNILVIKI